MRMTLVITLLTGASAMALAQDPVPPPAFPLEEFTAQGKIDIQNANSPGVFIVTAGFVLSPNSDGIYPEQEDLTVEIEPHPPEAQIPPVPCNLVAVPAGCLEQKNNGVYKMSDFQTCGMTWSLVTENGQSIDLTPFITDATVKMVPPETSDGIWTVKVKLQTLGLDPSAIPPQPCNLVANVGNDGGQTALHTVTKFTTP